MPCKMEDKTKIQHFRNLVSLSAADGKIHEAEKNALTKIADEQGIPMDRLEVMLKYAHEYVYLIPQNQQEKVKQLEEMINLALLDGEFAKEEYELIVLVAERLGITKSELDLILNTKRGQYQVE